MLVSLSSYFQEISIFNKSLINLFLIANMLHASGRQSNAGKLRGENKYHRSFCHSEITSVNLLLYFFPAHFNDVFIVMWEYAIQMLFQTQFSFNLSLHFILSRLSST